MTSEKDVVTMMAKKQKIFTVDTEGNRKEITRTVKENKQEDYIALAKYSNIGYYLVTPLLLGVAAGIGLDNLLHTKPLFTVCLIFLGTIATFYNLYKLVNEGRTSRTSHKHQS